MLIPEGFNELLGYPHGFYFATETPLLTLVAQRLVWDPKRDNLFSNGHWVSYVSIRDVWMGAAWLRQVYTHLRLWCMPPFVRHWL